MVGWTMLGMVATASRIAMWLDEMTASDGTLLVEGTTVFDGAAMADGMAERTEPRQ